MRIRLSKVMAMRAEGPRVIELEGQNVGAALHALAEQHPPLRQLLFTNDGDLRATHSLFLNGELLAPDSEEKPLHPDDELEIVSAVVGG